MVGSRTLRTALMKREIAVDNGPTMTSFQIPSPDFFFMWFDITLAVAFGGGWLYTLIYNKSVLQDNPILRAFEANNICVGVDKNGARVAANVAWGVMLLPLACYLLTSYIQIQLYEEKGFWATFDTALMIIAYLMLMTFGLCFGIEPEFDPERYQGLEGDAQQEYLDKSTWTIQVHTWGFCIALVGYALTRVVEIRSFLGAHYNKYKRKFCELKPSQKRYVILQFIHFLWCMGGSVPLFKTLMFDPLAHYVKKNPATEWQEIWLKPMSIVMWVWSIGILALPLIGNCCSDAAEEDDDFPMAAIHLPSATESGKLMY